MWYADVRNPGPDRVAPEERRLPTAFRPKFTKGRLQPEGSGSMPKRPPVGGREVPLPFTFHYGERSKTLQSGKATPGTYFLYSNAYALVANWLRDLLAAKPAVNKKLRAEAERADLKRMIRTRILNDASELGEHSFWIAALGSAIDNLPDQDIWQIVTHLVAPCYRIPDRIPQWTFQEARNLTQAVARPPRIAGSLWKSLSEETGVLWSRERDPLEVKYLPTTLAGAKNLDECEAALNEFDLLAVFCFHIVLGAVIASMEEVTLNVDDLICRLGCTIHNADDREEARRKVWIWLRNFESMWIIGRRRGDYGNAAIEIEEPLFRISGMRSIENSPPGQHSNLSFGPCRWLAGKVPE